MANRSTQAGDFSPPRNDPSVASEEKEERIIRRSEIIARERSLLARHSTRSTMGDQLVIHEKVKRKRRPPKVPWKKPPDMPKRPLSAYNLFFAHERERLLMEASSNLEASEAAVSSEMLRRGSANALGQDQDSDAEGAAWIPKVRRHTKTSGIGFANLAKTIGNKWRTIEPETRAFFEEQASEEKQRYINEVNLWRAKQPKGKINFADQDKKKRAKPSPPKRRQSSPPERMQITSPDSPPRSIERRASEPLPSPAFAFSFDHPTSRRGSDSSSWIEPIDGASLGSLDQHDWEDTLGFDSHDKGERPTPRRTLSDSMLQIRPEIYDDVRPWEDLAADIVDVDRRASIEEAKDTARYASLEALKESLDDDMLEFITALGKPHDQHQL